MTSQASVQSGDPPSEGWTFPLRASTTSCPGGVTMSLHPSDKLILPEAGGYPGNKLGKCCSCLSLLEEAESS